MKCAPWVFALIAAACSGDRPPPEPPPDPTEPFEDPVTSNIVGTAVGTTGPFMQNPPSMVAKSNEATTGSGGTLELSASTTASDHNSGTEHPHGTEPPVGVGGMGAMPGSQTLGGTNTGGRPLHSVSSDGKIR